MAIHVTISDKVLAIAEPDTKAVMGSIEDNEDLRKLMVALYVAWTQHAIKPENEALIKLA